MERETEIRTQRHLEEEKEGEVGKDSYIQKEIER